MKIELKKIRHATSQSEETNAFTADVYANGKKVAYAKNNGKGEMTHVQPYPDHKELLREAEAWAETLPPMKLEISRDEPMEIPMSLDSHIDRLVERDLIRKQIMCVGRTRLMAKSPEGKLIYYKVTGWKPGDDLGEVIRQQLKDRNEVPLNEERLTKDQVETITDMWMRGELD